MKWGKKLLALAAAGMLTVSLAACNAGAASQAKKQVEQMTAQEILTKTLETVKTAEAVDASLKLQTTIKAVGMSMDLSGNLDFLYKENPRQAKMEMQASLLGETFYLKSYLVEENGTPVDYTQMEEGGPWTRKETSWDVLENEEEWDQEKNTLEEWLLKKTQKNRIENVDGVKTAVLEAALTPQDLNDLLDSVGVSENALQTIGIPDISKGKDQSLIFTFYINTQDWTPTKISIDMADYLSAALETSMKGSLSDLPSGVTITEPLVSVDPCVLEIEFYGFGDKVKDVSVPAQAKQDTASSKAESKTAA